MSEKYFEILGRMYHYWCDAWWIMLTGVPMQILLFVTSIAWKSSLFDKSLLHQNARAACIVVSLVTETDLRVKIAVLNGYWEDDEQHLSWINTLSIIDSNQHGLPAGRCNVFEMPMSSLPNFPTNGFEASTTDVSLHRLTIMPIS